MARVHCSRCKKTFRNPSGLSWHTFHIHAETSEADKHDTGATAFMASEEASPDYQNSVEWVEALVEEVKGSYNQLRDSFEADETIVQRSEGRLIELQPRLDQMEKQLSMLEANQRDLQQLRESVANLGNEAAGLSHLVNALGRLVWTLDQDIAKGRELFDSLWIKKPTKEELREARRVLNDFLGMDPSFLDDILAKVVGSNADLDRYLSP